MDAALVLVDKIGLFQMGSSTCGRSCLNASVTEKNAVVLFIPRLFPQRSLGSHYFRLLG